MALNSKRLVIGVDGGGTKTAGVLMADDGRILAEYEVGSTNPHSNPEADVRARMGQLIQQLVEASGVDRGQVDGICLGMAGCDRPADRAFIENIVRGCIADRTKILIVNDAVVAMVAVLGRLHGILVIGGTGSIVLGYNDHTGATTRCGGWGHLLGDEGSGYMIGLEALRAIMKEFDGRGQATSLTPRMLAALELKSPTDLIGWTYMSGKGKTEIAALARHVHDEAEAGDAVAKRILAEQAALLAIQVGTVYKRLFGAAGERVSLALWGGNLVNSSGYRETFTAEVGRLGLPLDVVMRDERAVVGAATHMINHL